MPPDTPKESTDHAVPILAISGIRKEFPGVVALRNASLTLNAGEIHALVGANGAGKSTLIKIVTGVVAPDAGEVRLLGQPISFGNRADSMASGIAAVFQEFALVPTLSIRANLFLGSEPGNGFIIDQQEERSRAEEVMTRIGLTQSPETLVRNLSVANQQLVEIARALLLNAKVLLLDEPTASLSPREVDRLFPILNDLVARGMAILYISHRLEEVLSLASTVTVMRDGMTMGSVPNHDLSRDQLIEQMVGYPLAQEFPPKSSGVGQSILELRGVGGPGVHDVTMSVRRGEVLGIAGLVGAGRTELARLVFGAATRELGDIILDGRRVKIECPHDAVREGVGLLPEDRKAQGLVLKASAQFNFALANLESWSTAGFIHEARERERFADRADELSLRMSSYEQQAAQLSGGNQQKLLLARWLEKNSNVLIFDEPTRGVDVTAKREMYFLIRELTEQGKGIVVISSEFPELLGLCDRILVMRLGTIAGVVDDVTHATQETLMTLAV